MNAADALPPFAQYIKDHKARTIGRWFIGGIVDFMLTGAFIASAAEYWQRYRKHDSRRLKAFVLTLLAFNIVKSVQTIHLIWYRLILNFGDFIGTAIAIPTFGILDPFFAFFVARLWKMTEAVRTLRLVLIPTTLCILLGLAGYASLTAYIFSTNGSFLGKPTYDHVANASMGGVVAADLLITGLASYLMLSSSHAFHPSDTARTKVVSFIWSTALLPLVSEILKTALYLTVFQTDAFYVVFHFMSCKLYSLSVIYTLNSRRIAEPESDPTPKRLPRRNGVRRDSIERTDPLSSAGGGEKSQAGNNADVQSYDAWSTTFEFAPADGQRTAASVPA
ncbi:hypothetical protein AURDEDRAFT_172404 [Auricularia subglabra TFB-10046 SS5]|nr:hypothetical protein AURDEDRAFT_172404 [Auricularia subglabra TFB-10046 SS5]